tara:strand:+ start:174 stop:833 length:660 start_codon:yes stop_codon:yes gene_type:complete
MSNKKPVLIQSDFDNTITIGNVSEQIHDEFGPSDWDSIYKNYRLGKISVEESNIYSFRYLNYSEIELDKFVQKNVQFRSGFLEFYNYIQNQKIDYKIVSSGVDFYIKSSFKRLGIDSDNLSLHSGSSEFVNDGIEIKYFDPQGKVIRSEFKNNYTKYHKKQYSKIIYFGDSLTDLNSSLSSDYVFATGKLHDYYIKNRLKCVKFDDYNDMITKINEILI